MVLSLALVPPVHPSFFFFGHSAVRCVVASCNDSILKLDWCGNYQLVD